MLTSVAIPNSVTNIGNSAFYNCSGLTSITIGDGVTSIGEYVFAESYVLENVTFSNKDKTTVQGMDNYNWYLPSGCTIHCTNGDITLP